jgi:tetratricopeptide (TPR) repeat protein
VPEVPAALRDLVVERADGNPFYIEELVRALIDDGVIVKGEPDWSVDETRLSSVRIPPTLTGVLQSRLDGLAPGLHQLLQRASVVGRVFWDATAVALGRPAGVDEDETQALLEELRRREMILRREESGFAGTVEYVFRHAILRDVTYATLVPRQRRALHRLVGDWLLEMGGERAREHTGLVANHYEQAGEPTLAAGQLISAANAARGAAAFEEAMATLKRARELVAGISDAPAVKVEIEVLLGELQSLVGDIVAAQKTLEDVLPEARRSPHREILARLLGNLVRNAMFAEDLDAAHRVLEEALPLARELGDERQLMFILRQAGNLDAHDAAIAGPLFEESRALARKLGDVASERSVLNSMGNMHFMANRDSERALATYREALALSAQSDPYVEWMLRANMGDQNALLGQFAQSEEETQAALRIARKHGIPLGIATCLLSLGFLEVLRGDEETAIARLREAFLEYRARGAVPPSMIPSCAALALRRGQKERALAWIGYLRSRPGWVETQDPQYFAFGPGFQAGATAAEWEAAMAAGAGLGHEAVMREIGELLGVPEAVPATMPAASGRA